MHEGFDGADQRLDLNPANHKDIARLEDLLVCLEDEGFVHPVGLDDNGWPTIAVVKGDKELEAT